MNLQELEYIVAIADSWNITHAAEVLHISQPALSKFLANVERRLGSPLFERNNKSLRVTSLGEVYLKRAREILRIRDVFNMELQALDNRSREFKLSIGIQTLRAPKLNPQLHSAFASYFPDGHLTVSDGNRGELLERLQSGDLDLALTNDSDLPRDLEKTLLREDHIVVAAAAHKEIPSYREPGRQLDTVDMTQLQNKLFLLLSPDHSTYVLAEHIFASAGIHPPRREMMGKHEATLNLVAMGKGITFTLDSYLPLFHLIAPLKAYYVKQFPQPVGYMMVNLRGHLPEKLKPKLTTMLLNALQQEEKALANSL